MHEQTKEYVLRTIYWLTHSRPLKLHDHIEQERFVAKFSEYKPDSLQNFDVLNAYYTKHRD